MTLETTSIPRTRRALLAGGLGGLVGVVASAFGRPTPARAGSDGDVVLMAENQGWTTIHNGGPDTGSTAITGSSENGTGVYGLTTTGRVAAVAGVNANGHLGVLGWSKAPGEAWGTAATKTGVYGKANQDATSVGVTGWSNAGSGVAGFSLTGHGLHGHASGGIGVVAKSENGLAIQVEGKARLSRSGTASIGAGRSYVDVDLRTRGGLSASSLPFATLLSYRSGTYVAAVRRNYPSTGKMRIQLNKAVTKTTSTSWMVLD